MSTKWKVGLIISGVASVMGVIGFILYAGGDRYGYGILLCLLAGVLAIVSYCIGGFLNALKMAWSIAKWGWVHVLFPINCVTFFFTCFFGAIAFFLVPFIPVYKAYKKAY